MQSLAFNLYRRTFSYIKSVDLIFLAFMILIFNVSLPMKVTGLLLLYLFRFNFRFIFSDFKTNSQPRFYILMIVLTIVGLFLNYRLWNANYFVLSAFGIVFWLISSLVLNQLKQAVEKTDNEKLHRTVQLFFVLNAIVSISTLLGIILITKSNPYTFEGMDLKYHTSTGDSIKGILFDFSSTNAVINVFGFIYFLYKQNFKTALLCLIVLLITTSNVNNVVLSGVLILIVVFHKNKLFKTVAVCSLGLIVIFYAKITPTNTEYMNNEFNKTSSKKMPLPVVSNSEPAKKEPSAEEVKRQQTEIFQRYYISNVAKKVSRNNSDNQRNINIAINKLHSREREIQSQTDPVFKEQMQLKQRNLADYMKDFYHDTAIVISEFQGKDYPGKLMSCVQTVHYILSGIKPCIFGAGAGMFSSKTAFKASGIGTFGKYPAQFKYLSPEFSENHLRIYCYFFSQPVGKHSVTNTPFSAYNQLLGEYGILGILVFAVFYIWFFLKRFKSLSYGRLLLPLCLFFLISDYWFEHLSIIIMFELLMLMDLKQSTTSKNELETHHENRHNGFNAGL